MTDKILLGNPIDLHVHLRTGPMMTKVIPFTAKLFSAAVAMGNLSIPVKTTGDMFQYKAEIDLYNNGDFAPIMGIMLTPETTPEMIEEAHFLGARFIKNIPQGISTNGCGVVLAKMHKIYPVLCKARDLEMPLLIHSEIPVEISDYYSWADRVDLAIPFLKVLVKELPELKIVIEHANTGQLIEFVKKAPPNVKATITCHHQILTWKDVVDKKGSVINPLNFCLPLAGTEKDRLAVVEAATSGNPKFAFGSDSAPHYLSAKSRFNPSAGILSEPVAIQLLCEIFEKEGKLENLQNFISPSWAPEFYGFKPIEKTIVLVKRKWIIPFEYEGIPIFKGGTEINWSIE